MIDDLIKMCLLSNNNKGNFHPNITHAMTKKAPENVQKKIKDPVSVTNALTEGNENTSRVLEKIEDVREGVRGL